MYMITMETPSPLTFTVSGDPKLFNKTHKYRLRPKKYISDFSYCNLLLSQYTPIDLFYLFVFLAIAAVVWRRSLLRFRASPFLDMLISAEYWLLLPESNTLHSEKKKLLEKEKLPQFLYKMFYKKR